MLNVDKYREAIMNKNVDMDELDCHIAALRGIKDCGKFECSTCMRASFKWIFSEYEPPLLENGDDLKPGDWIMVRNDDDWEKLRFVCYYNNDFWTLYDNEDWFHIGSKIIPWAQARLPEDGE